VSGFGGGGAPGEDSPGNADYGPESSDDSMVTDLTE